MSEGFRPIQHTESAAVTVGVKNPFDCFFTLKDSNVRKASKHVKGSQPLAMVFAVCSSATFRARHVATQLVAFVTASSLMSGWSVWTFMDTYFSL